MSLASKLTLSQDSSSLCLSELSAPERQTRVEADSALAGRGASGAFTSLHQTPVGLPLMLCQNADPLYLSLHTIPEDNLRLKMISLDLQNLLLFK